MINGAPARYGTTVFRGDVLQTKNALTTVVILRSGASLAISENSEVALELADPAAGTERMDLHRGAINLRNPRPQPEWVMVPGASLLVQGEGGFPAVCRIAAFAKLRHYQRSRTCGDQRFGRPTDSSNGPVRHPGAGRRREAARLPDRQRAITWLLETVSERMGGAASVPWHIGSLSEAGSLGSAVGIGAVGAAIVTPFVTSPTVPF